ncbi:hypothetical protein N6O34_10090, partial [Escherichia coli]|nr:hypothetical protein [Escherichia coli]MDC7028492.1 hypothetical protein [Escherichia coli]
ADRNRSHWSTSKTPSYTKSVSWQHHPKTHEVVGYRYFGLDDPAYLVWFGEIGVHEFAYLVKNYVAAVN